MERTASRHSQRVEGIERKTTDGASRHPKFGFPGVIQRTRTELPDDASDDTVFSVAYTAYQEDRDPSKVYEEVADGE